ncbi:hypothetical protein BDZ91DRAFT_322745 [Kalaharituber pfeilii]|nr:hypothetical protein BDZ91DRAFT_322745 [Kalaharituber pfeilii]
MLPYMVVRLASAPPQCRRKPRSTVVKSRRPWHGTSRQCSNNEPAPSGKENLCLRADRRQRGKQTDRRPDRPTLRTRGYHSLRPQVLIRFSSACVFNSLSLSFKVASALIFHSVFFASPFLVFSPHAAGIASIVTVWRTTVRDII